jgi:hypothetical protein
LDERKKVRYYLLTIKSSYLIYLRLILKEVFKNLSMIAILQKVTELKELIYHSSKTEVKNWVMSAFMISSSSDLQFTPTNISGDLTE